VLLNDVSMTSFAFETLQLLRRETPDFISPDLWPPNSPDLNSVDYEIWAVMQRHVYKTKIHTIDELKHDINIVQILTGAEVNTKKLCPEVVQTAVLPEGLGRVTLHN